MAICILLHWMLKLFISLFKCIKSLVLLLSHSSVLHVSPVVFSTSHTSWQIPLLTQQASGCPAGVVSHVDSPRCGILWGSGGAVGTLVPSRVRSPSLLGKQGHCFKKLSSNWKEITFIILPPKHSYLCFSVIPLSLYLFVYNHCTCTISWSAFPPQLA